MFGSKLVSCDAAGLPFGMVSEPRRRLEPTLAGGLVEYLAVKMHFRVSAEFLELCQRASTGKRRNPGSGKRAAELRRPYRKAKVTADLGGPMFTSK